MEITIAIVASIAAVIIEFFIAWAITKAEKRNIKVQNEILLLHIKHDAWIYSYQKHTGNGLLETYNETVQQLMEQKKFVQTN